MGIGWGGPLNLASLPLLGQAAQGVTAGVSALPSSITGSAAAARALIRRVGVPGLDAGIGCGVGLGYGFGAGVMLRPSALEQVAAAGSALMGALAAALPLNRHATGSGSVAAHGSGEAGAGAQMSPSLQQQQQQQMLLPAAAAAAHGQQPLQQQPQPDALLSRALLQQQQEVVQLRQQVRTLRHSLCELHPSAPVCAAGGVWSDG